MYQLDVQAKEAALVGWFRRLLGANKDATAVAESNAVAELRARCADLDKRILWSREKLEERRSAFTELQLQYSDEHARLQQSLNDLHSERVRNSALFSNRDLAISQARLLQARVGRLKERLAKYEEVAEGPFDRVPIVLENAPLPGEDPTGEGFKLH
jgi:predicted nuclease with TOPRIM domain